MRMRSENLMLGSERGAAAVMVALVLIILMGVSALAVDGGGLYSKRRHVVTATDAATLAAAQWCAKTGNTQATAQTQADSIATANLAAAVRDSFLVPAPGHAAATCGTSASGSLQVTYHDNQPLYFSRFLGFGSQKTVHATATAVWGAAGSSNNLMPFMLSAGRLSTCQFPNVAIGTKCAFWWNNRTSQIANAAWGMMNFNQWNVTPTTNCTSAGTTDTFKWMNGGAGVLSLNWKNPTYVCVDTGVSQTIFGTNGNPTCTPGSLSNSLVCQVGQQRDFPVNDPCDLAQSLNPGDTTIPRQGQINKTGGLVRPTANLPVGCDLTIPTGTPDKYDIIGFTSLLITGVWRGNDPAAADPVNGCGAVPGFTNDSNGECLVASWQGFHFGGSVGGGGGNNFGLTAVNLIG